MVDWSTGQRLDRSTAATIRKGHATDARTGRRCYAAVLGGLSFWAGVMLWQATVGTDSLPTAPSPSPAARWEVTRLATVLVTATPTRTATRAPSWTPYPIPTPEPTRTATVFPSDTEAG